MSDSPVLLVASADLPTLAAASLEPDPGRLILWHPARGDDADERQQEVLRDLGIALNATRVVGMRLNDFGFRDCEPPPAPLLEAHMLLAAVIAARQFGARRLVWPVQAAAGIDELADAIDRIHAAVALARIGAGDEPAADLAIDLPIVDLDDRELVEVTTDAGAPMQLFWPCEAAGPAPCGGCPGCERWIAAFHAAGTPWPFAMTPAAATC